MQTIVNEKEYKYYDQFIRFVRHLEKEIIDQNDYKGYPKLPDDYHVGIDIYLNADAEQKRFIFEYLYVLCVEAIIFS